ncbi:uncharacterized protein [Henckelia pumila]|uniref:uncharacterized protein n=1 Tax=Henckelia pumila TaxID=405737 RepID=UPI003C6DDFBD
MIRRQMLFEDVLPGTTMRIVLQVPTAESGHNDEDILKFAYEKYRDENNGVAFNLEHVWRIFKDRPMFTPQSDDHFVATKKTRTSESVASYTSSNQNVSIDLDDEDTRPMGQKATKIKGKYKVKSTLEELTLNYDNMFAKFNEYTSVKKSEVNLKQKYLKLRRLRKNLSCPMLKLRIVN